MDLSNILIVVFAVFLLVLLYRKFFSGNVMKPDEFKEKMKEEGGEVIDVRTPKEYSSGHLKMTSYNLDVTSGDFTNKIEKLDRDQSYYLYCRSGARSSKAARMMQNNGFEKVYNIGGYNQLARHGLETSKA